MKIDEIQSNLTKSFSQIIQKNRLSHAYLFSGTFGSYEMAIWLAQSLFCEDLTNGLPCENCRACRLVVSDDFTDFHLIKPEGQTIKTAQIRDLTAVFSQSGYESNKKAVVILEAEKMHANAANALLKSMEEPENDVYIFLLTGNENLILPTIKSRTQVVNFPKNEVYFQNLLEKENLLPSQANLLAKLTDNVDEALEFAKKEWFTVVCQKLQEFVKRYKTSTDEAYLYLSNLTAVFDDKPKQKLAFQILSEYFLEEKNPKILLKILQAEKMWQSNVNFLSCLEMIVIGENK